MLSYWPLGNFTNQGSNKDLSRKINSIKVALRISLIWKQKLMRVKIIWSPRSILSVSKLYSKSLCSSKVLTFYAFNQWLVDRTFRTTFSVLLWILNKIYFKTQSSGSHFFSNSISISHAFRKDFFNSICAGKPVHNCTCTRKLSEHRLWVTKWNLPFIRWCLCFQQPLPFFKVKLFTLFIANFFATHLSLLFALKFCSH